MGLSILVTPESPSLDIVFIHGFTGHPERTWTCKKGVPDDHNGNPGDGSERPQKFRKIFHSGSSQKSDGTSKDIYWPRDLIPITIPSARVLTYGYDTNIRHSLGPAVNKSTVYDIAWDFLVDLENERRLAPSRPLLFIVHSLGGVVAKEALRRSRGCETYQSHLRSIFESTCGIFFFGTPHGGADPGGLLLHIAKQCMSAMGFSVNDQIIKTLLPSSERLKELRNEFSPMARQQGWIVYSFQEQYGLKALLGNKVVEDVASCLDDPTVEVTQHITSNHMDMCRFGGLDDVEYGKVVGALNRVVEATGRITLDLKPLLSAEQRQKYLESLWFDQIDSRHATIKNAHAKTCTWLLSKSEYQDWLDINKIFEHHGFLWIKGKPGAGKSTIIKFAYASAKRKMTDTTIVSFFFNARGGELEKSTLGMYRSLLFQLLKEIPELQSTFDAMEPTAPDRGNLCTWEEIEALKNLFGHAIERLGRRSLVCFIDALDECGEDQVREMVDFFEDLGEMAVSSQTRFLICFSSRHYPQITIENSVQLILDGQEGHQQDIANYLHSKLKAGRSTLTEQIKTEILERASGIFLWVVLIVPMLNTEYDRGRLHALRKRLDEIPTGLDKLFQDILRRDSENSEELILCLQWILYARRPLKPEELYYAIISGTEPLTLTAWNPEEITREDMARFVLNSSKGLAEITKSKTPTIQFIHESVRDFFLKGNGLSRLRSDFGSNFAGISHNQLKQCCQIYMSVDISLTLLFKDPLPVANSDEARELRQQISERFPFLEYAIWNVLHHADAADGCGILQDSFVENFPLRDWIALDNVFEKYEIRRHTPNASLLYILAEKNFANLIRIELNRVPHMDICGERYHYPLFAALNNANEDTVRVLLAPETGAQPDSDMPSDKLFCLAKGDYEETIRSLLENREFFPRFGPETLLLQATKRRDVTLAAVLLATRKVSFYSKDKYGRTALSFAAANGHEAIVQLLLDTGKASFNFQDNNRSTALSITALFGNEAIVKLLLDTGKANFNFKDKYGQTALSSAVVNGHEAIVKLLLDTGKADINSKDEYGRTALSLAAANGHKVIVKSLLDTGKADINSKNNNGSTALSITALFGNEAIVKLLLDTGKADINSKDEYGSTALSLAEMGRHEAIVKLLLDTGNIGE